MSQGLFTASSGIHANQAKIDIVADNIANINTIGFKSSQLNFETVFAKTLSSGSAPTTEAGGVNPKQVGLGVQVGEIGRNFSKGSIHSTGRNTDLNIQGDGFFTMQNYDGKIFLSRAGNFSTDSNGNLVNPQGLKVIGTSTELSTSSSSTPIRIPTALKFTETNIINDGTTSLTAGDFTINVNSGGAVNVNITDSDNLSTLVNKINSVLGSDGTATVDANGQITVNMGAGNDVVFANGSTNFSTLTGLASIAAGGSDTSNAMFNSMVTVAEADSTSDSYTMTTFSISKDGGIEATYSNGARLTVDGKPRVLKYVTSSGNIITEGNANFNMTGTPVSAGELQIQLAQVINPNGLESVGGNLFALNSIAGQPTFAIGRSGGLGLIDSGALEASNVDLPTEFANMILAQRGIEANSRTFEVQNQIMRTIVNLGR